MRPVERIWDDLAVEEWRGDNQPQMPEKRRAFLERSWRAKVKGCND
jgi:hypothetical protein